MSLLSLLIGLIILGVVGWCARALIAAFKIPEPIATVIIVLLVLLSLFVVLGWFGVPTGIRLR